MRRTATFSMSENGYIHGGVYSVRGFAQRGPQNCYCALQRQRQQRRHRYDRISRHVLLAGGRSGRQVGLYTRGRFQSDVRRWKVGGARHTAVVYSPPFEQTSGPWLCARSREPVLFSARPCVAFVVDSLPVFTWCIAGRGTPFDALRSSLLAKVFRKTFGGAPT